MVCWKLWLFPDHCTRVEVSRVIRDGERYPLKAKDSVGLACHCHTLSRSGTRYIMGKKGQQLAKDHFSLPLMVEQMTKLYDDMFR